MNIESSSNWLENIYFDSERVEEVKNLKTYKRDRLINLIASSLSGLIFLMIPIAGFLQFLSIDSPDFIIIIGFSSIFLFMGIKILVSSYREFSYKISGVIPGRFIEKHKRYVTKNRKRHVRFFIVVDVGGTKITLRTEERSFKIAEDGVMLWITKEERKGLERFRIIADKEFEYTENIFERPAGGQDYRTDDNNCSSDITSNDEESHDEEIPYYESEMWYLNKEKDRLESNVFQSTREYVNEINKTNSNIKMLLTILFISSLIMYLFSFLTYMSRSFNLIVPIIATALLTLAIYVLLNKDDFFIVSLDKAFVGKIVDKYTLSIFSSGVLYIFKVLVKNEVVEFSVDKDLYEKLSRNDEVWIYKFKSKLSTVNVIHRWR